MKKLTRAEFVSRLKEIKLQIEEEDIIANGKLDKLIRGNHITSVRIASFKREDLLAKHPRQQAGQAHCGGVLARLDPAREMALTEVREFVPLATDLGLPLLRNV